MTDSIGLFQTLEYHDWIAEGVKLDFMTCVYVSISPFYLCCYYYYWCIGIAYANSFFIINSAIGIGYGDIYPKTGWGKLVMLIMYTLIIINVPKNVMHSHGLCLLIDRSWYLIDYIRITQFREIDRVWRIKQENAISFWQAIVLTEMSLLCWSINGERILWEMTLFVSEFERNTQFNEFNG